MKGAEEEQKIGFQMIEWQSISAGLGTILGNDEAHVVRKLMKVPPGWIVTWVEEVCLVLQGSASVNTEEPPH